MHPKPSRRLVGQVDVVHFAAITGDLDWVRCLHCRGHLCLHQPDPECPGRLVGFCETCRGWCFLLSEPDAGEAVMVLLPSSDWFRSVRDACGLVDYPGTGGA